MHDNSNFEYTQRKHFANYRWKTYTDALYHHVALTWLRCHSVVAMETSVLFTKEGYYIW